MYLWRFFVLFYLHNQKKKICKKEALKGKTFEISSQN